MPINITMPALSPTMEEGNLAKWLVKEGDSVASGDVIAEIETDKATMEVEAVDEGTVAKILVPAGTEGVKVNAVIAILAAEGEDVSAIPISPPAGEVTPQKREEGKTQHADNSTPTVLSDISSSGGGTEFTAKATPLAKRVAAQDGVDLSSIQGSGAHGKIVLADVQNPSGASAGIAQASSGDRVFASPLARKMAKDAGFEISVVSGTGPNGRIIADNVKAFIVSGGSKTAVAPVSPSAAKPTMSDDKILALYKEGSYELLPHNGMRRVIAERLTESSQTIPSYFITMECEIDALLALRGQMNAAAPVKDDKPAFKISVNDIIVKAMAMALQAVPMANASWSANNRIIHKHSDVGVAVAVEDGLFTPIVRKAELKKLSEISAEVKDMAGRARNKKLQPQEYQGGSTAVSNLGMFGVDNFTSIINPPHASIVSIGAGIKKPVIKDDQVVPATIMNATFAFDHRVIDGALGAELASKFKEFIEKPIGMLV